MSVNTDHPILTGLVLTQIVIDPNTIKEKTVFINDVGLPVFKNFGLDRSLKSFNEKPNFIYSQTVDNKKQYKQLKVVNESEAEIKNIINRIEKYTSFVRFNNALKVAPGCNRSSISDWCPIPYFDFIETTNEMCNILNEQKKLPNRRALNKILENFRSSDFVSLDEVKQFYEVILAKRFPENDPKESSKTHSNMMEAYLKMTPKSGESNVKDIEYLENIFNKHPSLFTYNVLLKAYNFYEFHEKFNTTFANQNFTEKDDWTYAEYITSIYKQFGQEKMLEVLTALLEDPVSAEKVEKRCIRNFLENINNDYLLAINVYLDMSEASQKRICGGLFEEIFKCREALTLWLKVLLIKDDDFMEKLKTESQNLGCSLDKVDIFFSIDYDIHKKIDKILNNNSNIHFDFIDRLYDSGYYKLAQQFYHKNNDICRDRLIDEDFKRTGVKIDLHHYIGNGNYEGAFPTNFCELVIKDFLDSLPPDSPKTELQIITGKGKFKTKGKVEEFFRTRNIKISTPQHNNGMVIANNISKYVKTDSTQSSAFSELISIINLE